MSVVSAVLLSRKQARYLKFSRIILHMFTALTKRPMDLKLWTTTRRWKNWSFLNLKIKVTSWRSWWMPKLRNRPKKMRKRVYRQNRLKERAKNKLKKMMRIKVAVKLLSKLRIGKLRKRLIWWELWSKVSKTWSKAIWFKGIKIRSLSLSNCYSINFYALAMICSSALKN